MKALDLAADEIAALRLNGECAIRRPAEPLACFTRTTIRPDFPLGMVGDKWKGVAARPSVEHPVTLNRNGAVTAQPMGLGLKPREFDFVCPLADGRTYLDGGWRIDVRDGDFYVTTDEELRGRIVSVVLVRGDDNVWRWSAEAVRT